MGDLFSRMAERAMGNSARIRPDRRPESTLDRTGGHWDVEETFVAPSDQKPGETSSESTLAVRSFARWTGDDELRQPKERAEHATESISDQPPVLNRPSPRFMLATEVKSPTQDASHGQQPVSVDRANHPTSESTFADDERDVNEMVDSVHQEIRQPIASNRNAEVGYASEQVSGISRETQQTIHVSIGRVEVRAVTPTATALRERPRERQMAARMSLDEYLRQRNERRR